MLTMLLAYDAAGNVIATLDHLVGQLMRLDLDDLDDTILGLIDFEAHELAGGEMTDVWSVQGAVGSKTWPEWIGGRAHDFRVELVGPPGNKRIGALVHKASGHRRERAAVAAAIAARIKAAKGEAADIRDIVGGPDRPLVLNDEGKTIGRPKVSGTPTHLPIVGVIQPRADQ